MMSASIMLNIWRKSYLVSINKNKRNAQEYGNYKGINLTSHITKMREKLKLREVTTVPRNQFGFISRTLTMKPIFPVLQLREHLLK